MLTDLDSILMFAPGMLFNVTNIISDALSDCL